MNRFLVVFIQFLFFLSRKTHLLDNRLCISSLWTSRSYNRKYFSLSFIPDFFELKQQFYQHFLNLIIFCSQYIESKSNSACDELLLIRINFYFDSVITNYLHITDVGQRKNQGKVRKFDWTGKVRDFEKSLKKSDGIFIRSTSNDCQG